MLHWYLQEFVERSNRNFFDALQQWMLKNPKGPLRQFAPTFGFSSTVKEYLTL